MVESGSPESCPTLRIFCVEDNTLLVMDSEAVTESAGHVFAGSAARSDDAKRAFGILEFDLALIDIDLADGRTGGEVAEWLRARGCPSLFVTGQEQLAEQYAGVSLGIIPKPVSELRLRRALSLPGAWQRRSRKA
jgi:DNA-binding response OmpR family regulator